MVCNNRKGVLVGHPDCDHMSFTLDSFTITLGCTVVGADYDESLVVIIAHGQPGQELSRYSDTDSCLMHNNTPSARNYWHQHKGTSRCSHSLPHILANSMEAYLTPVSLQSMQMNL